MYNNIEQNNFKREISLFGGVSIIAGAMIGSGIFYLGSFILKECHGNIYLALICWLIGGSISLFGGLCFAELGSAMPKTGGYIVYLSKAFHPIVGFMSGFTDFFIGGPGSNAAISIALMSTLQIFYPISPLTVKIGAIIIIIVISLYNLFGVKLVSKIQNIFMIAKLVPILIILLFFFIEYLIGDKFSINIDININHINLSNIFSMLALGIVISLWAYEGWMNLNTVTEEMHNPERNLSLSLLIGILAVTIIYIVFNYAIMIILSNDSIINSIDDMQFASQSAIILLGNWGGILVTIGMLIAMFGALNGFMLAGPRLCYAIALEGHFFKCFAKLHPKYAVPTNAIILQGITSSLLVLYSSLEQLTQMVVVSMMTFKLLTILSVPILRKKYPNINRPYKVPFYPYSVIITALLFFILLINSMISDVFLGIIGLSVPLLGAIIYICFELRNHK